MRQLFAFLWKHYFFFLFVLLESLAVLLLINNSFYHRSYIIRHTNQFTGSILQQTNKIDKYFSLDEENQKLQQENIALRSQLNASFLQTDSSFTPGPDSLAIQQYQYTPAQVISNSTRRPNNYLMLNKGTKHGINKDMAVISPQGLVGMVIQSSENFSWVMSILHQQSNISVKILNSNQMGSLIWDGKNIEQGIITQIPSHVKINFGDTIITSGYSYIFPKDIIVGTVLKSEIKPGDHFFTLTIKFHTNFNSIHHVTVIKNLLQEEQKNLQSSLNNE